MPWPVYVPMGLDFDGPLHLLPISVGTPRSISVDTPRFAGSFFLNHPRNRLSQSNTLIPPYLANPLNCFNRMKDQNHFYEE